MLHFFICVSFFCCCCFHFISCVHTYTHIRILSWPNECELWDWVYVFHIKNQCHVWEVFLLFSNIYVQNIGISFEENEIIKTKDVRTTKKKKHINICISNENLCSTKFWKRKPKQKTKKIIVNIFAKCFRFEFR